MNHQPQINPTAEGHVAAPRPSHRARWIVLTVVICLVTGLAAARAALPSYLRSYVNRTLGRGPDYDGRIGEIDVHLWRGAYTINDMKIAKTTNSVPVPFFEARRVDFSLNWNALAHGMARGKMVLDDPQINFVQGPTIEDTQTGADQAWLSMIDALYPFRIDRADIHNGEIHFQAFHTKPPVNVYLSSVEGTITNLTNVQNSLDPLIANVTARGQAMHSGRFDFTMDLDPHAHRPNFSLAARLLDVDVTQLNSLTKAYGDFDFESGSFDFVTEITTKDGFIDGYAKPLFRNLRVLSLRKIASNDPLQVFWEALVGLMGEVFKNQNRNQFGTRLTLQGDLDNPRMSILEIVGNVLRNAFVRAYLPKIEGRTDTDQ